MKPRTRAWVFVSASAAWACGNTSTPSAPLTQGGTNTSGDAGNGAAGALLYGGAGGALQMAGSGGAGAAGLPSGGGNETPGANSTGGSANGDGSGGPANGDGGSSSLSPPPKRALLYHFSTLVIDSLPAQLTILKTQLQTWGYGVEDSVEPSDINATNLARFSAVGMINTCFEPFGVGKMGTAETAALAAFVDNGGGLFGTHCASVTFQAAQPPHPYNAVIGGRGGHGSFDGKSACQTVEAHPTTAQLPSAFDFTGNLDNADYLAPDTHVLVKCRWSGGDKKETAVSWYRTPGKGRVFYTNFAKVDANLSDPLLGKQHILVGLGWVLGR